MFRVRPSRRINAEDIATPSVIEKFKGVEIGDEVELDSNSKLLKGTAYCIRDDKIVEIKSGLTWKELSGKFKGNAFDDTEEFLNNKVLAYKVLAETINVVEQSMVNELGLEVLVIPAEKQLEDMFQRPPENLHTKIIVSKNALKGCKKLVVLINSFDMRSWLWSSRMVYEESFKEGTVYSYAEHLLNLGYEVLIANPNANLFVEGEPSYLTHPKTCSFPIAGHETYEKHILTLFKNTIFPSEPEKIFIIGHSYAGHGLIELINQEYSLCEKYINAIALIDSVHSAKSINSEDGVMFLADKVFNWYKGKDDPEINNDRVLRYGCNCLSAGEYEYEEGIPHLKSDIFKYFDSRN